MASKALNRQAFNQLTPYQEINELLFFACNSISDILADTLTGIYLTGSLTYDDFVPGRSDIDLVVIVNEELLKTVVKKIRQFHLDLEKRYPQWKERIECSYLPVVLLNNILPPKTPRPYMGGGKFYAEAPYGNEWIINLYFLHRYGVTLIGPNFNSLLGPIDMNDVQEACAADLFTEWAPKVSDQQWLQNDHYRSYLVLNLCRILHTILYREAASKTVSAKWARVEFPEWAGLIDIAMNWEYGATMTNKEKAIEFLQFAIDKIRNNVDQS